MRATRIAERGAGLGRLTLETLLNTEYVTVATTAEYETEEECYILHSGMRLFHGGWRPFLQKIFPQTTIPNIGIRARNIRCQGQIRHEKQPKQYSSDAIGIVENDAKNPLESFSLSHSGNGVSFPFEQ